MVMVTLRTPPEKWPRRNKINKKSILHTILYYTIYYIYNTSPSNATEQKHNIIQY